jgi:hypothetical protein
MNRNGHASLPRLVLAEGQTYGGRKPPLFHSEALKAIIRERIIIPKEVQAIFFLSDFNCR